MSKRYKITVKYKHPRKVNQFAYTPGSVEDPEYWKLPAYFELIEYSDRELVEFSNEYIERWRRPSQAANGLNKKLRTLLMSLQSRSSLRSKLSSLLDLYKRYPGLKDEKLVQELFEKYKSMESEIGPSVKLLSELKKAKNDNLQALKLYRTQKRIDMDLKLAEEIIETEKKINVQKEIYGEMVIAAREISLALKSLYKSLDETFDNLSPNEKKSMRNFIQDNLIFLSPLFGENVDNAHSLRGCTSGQFVQVIENFINGDLANRKYILRIMSGSPNYFFSTISNSRSDMRANGEMITNNFSPLYEELKRLNYPLSSGSLETSGFSLLEIKNTLMSKLKIDEKELGVFPARYYSDFGLYNSSQKEFELFDNLHKVGLNPIPANDTPIVYFDIEGKGKNRGFIIDFILPCQLCVCDDDECNLSPTVKIVGEYFGYYGEDYETKKTIKIDVQKSFEPIISSSYLHFLPKDSVNPCPKLIAMNIASGCEGASCQGKFNNTKEPDDEQRKLNYIIAKQHIFLYTYLLNEAIQNIPGENRAENLTKQIYDNVVNKRSEFLDHFEFLKNLINHSDKDNKFFVDQCNLILEAYKEELAKRTIKSARYKITIR